MAKTGYLRIEHLTTGMVEDYDKWNSVVLGTDMVTIGRPTMDRNEIQPDIKIVGDDYVSRPPKIVEIYYSFTDDRYYLRDREGTTNGTFLNGDLVLPNTPCELEDNDLIGLAKASGQIRILLRFRDSEGTLKESNIHVVDWRPPPGPGLRVDVKARKVAVDSKEIYMTKTEWRVFEFMYSRSGQVCTLDDISEAVWGEYAATNELIQQYVHRLREYLEPNPRKPRYLLRHRAGGYYLDLSV